MDAIKLEMDKNDQFEMIKCRPHFTPHLSGAELNGLLIKVHTSLFFFSSVQMNGSSIKYVDAFNHPKQPDRQSQPASKAAQAEVEDEKAFSFPYLPPL